MIKMIFYKDLSGGGMKGKAGVKQGNLCLYKSKAMSLQGGGGSGNGKEMMNAR